MAERPGTGGSSAAGERPDLDGPLAELEALVETAGQRLTPAAGSIPRLTDRVADFDPVWFESREAEPAGDDAPAEPPAPVPGELLHEVQRIVDDGVRQAVTSLKADVLSDLKRELAERARARAAQRPPPAASSAATTISRQPQRDQASVAPKHSEPMAKTYDPQGIEQSRYAHWESAGHFRPRGPGEPYCIMLPPPNVTGSLHMGHAFQDTLMDALIRYQRMRGRSALWQCGTDHAGIATQMVVERQLAAQGHTRATLGRERFVAEVWKWKSLSGGTITRQLRRMGASMDWSRERFTLDPDLSTAVTEVFVRLFDEGLIYRGKRLVNWDPVLHTAISDLEVVAEEENGHLWHIRYPLEDGSGHVVVATTRPETMLGDVAVAVHPEDARYRRLIGRAVRLPLTGRSIPVIADTYVDPEFGSGCVKITPAHDFNDYAIGARHQLPLINIFTEHATLSDTAPAVYRGMDRFAARARIVEDLRAADLIARIDDHRLTVPRGDRSHAVLEPFLTDQWFVRVEPLAAPAIRAVDEGRTRFVPENWSKTYFEWMRNLEDWCISRQLWWGHRIPAWYDDQGHVHVGRTEDEARARAGLAAGAALRQDPDVLDTWFSSALWPFSTLGWPAQTAELSTYYPTSVLVTGFDIIFFWVARMIMMGLKFMGEVPFREIYIHGLVRDAEGSKMSKSKGNILDPIDLIDGIDLAPLVAKRTTGLMRPEDAPQIDKATRRQFPQGIPGYGTDALRFTFASMATQGRDIRFDLGRIEGYRNFCNKIWNAARFVMMACESDAGGDRQACFGLPEQWIAARLQAMLRSVHEGFETYRFDLAAQALHTFVWDEYCDWYIELAKVHLHADAGDAALACGTRVMLVRVLETLLRALHPIMPFITEEVWQRIAPLAGIQGETIMTQPYPAADPTLERPAATEAFAWLSGAILGIRRIRAEHHLDTGTRLRVLARGGTPAEQAWLAEHGRYIRALARVAEIRVTGEEPAPNSATVLAGAMTLFIPLAELVDVAAEITRIERELERLAGELQRTAGKLDNPAFVTKAPPDIVAKERQRGEDLTGAIERLREQLEKLQQ